MSAAIRLGGGHCCICTGVCYHIGGISYCATHDPARVQPVVVLDRNLAPNAVMRPCPAKQTAVLGFHTPTLIPCGLLEGHDGPHRYSIEWTTK